MGFVVGYSELPFPTLLLRLVLLLGYVRRLTIRAFDAVGLGDLVDDSDAPCPERHAGGGGGGWQNQQHPEFCSVSAMLIEEFLPVVRYDDLGSGGGGGHVAGECAVCLYDFEGEAEVRRLSNCRHVFHRCCLDRWMEHEQRTCPLCRAPLFPEEEMLQDDAFNDRVWDAAGIPDSYADAAAAAAAEYSPSFPFTSSSPDLFLPLPLLVPN